MEQTPVPTRLAASLLAAGQDSRRQQTRNALRCPVSIAIAGGHARMGTTVDLSQDGLSLSTDRPIAPGSRCTLCLHPGDPARSLWLEVKSVYSSYSAPGDFRIGVVFTVPDAQAQGRLRALAAQG
ncbi:PilZ domain-containing protein [Pseudorhodoferax sp. Leaf267]|uniref:PilZ domain-containing protein n=1 Tax=Pseudorhodoferax sp. Leaf267 TaxID=1736316 RepID=UPI0006F3C3B2|nr:PilZ domain-containing protein [Pseudorhodoferax sp. Leaf267]KQP12304.1 hypothetical protein ASF43_22660 [Pseudorhodoferax sp. Leaf267]